MACLKDMRVLLCLGAALLGGCGGFPEGLKVDAGVLEVSGGEAPAPAVSTCHCTPAVRSSGPTPGFSLFCGPGQVTLAGGQSWFGPGTDVLSGGALNGGCPVGQTPSGEGAPAGCCLPAPLDAGT